MLGHHLFVIIIFIKNVLCNNVTLNILTSHNVSQWDLHFLETDCYRNVE